MSKQISIMLILFESIIVYFVSKAILYSLFLRFYTGNPAKQMVPFTSSYISVGIAVAYFTIVMIVYPVIKFRERGVFDE